MGEEEACRGDNDGSSARGRPTPTLRCRPEEFGGARPGRHGPGRMMRTEKSSTGPLCETPLSRDSKTAHDPYRSSGGLLPISPPDEALAIDEG